MEEFENWELFLGRWHEVSIVWGISGHIKTSIKPSISNGGGHGGVLEETTDHSELWVKCTKRDAVLVLGVPYLDLVGEDRLEDDFEVSGLIDFDLAVNELDVLELEAVAEEEEDGVLHGEVQGGLHVGVEAQEGLVALDAVVHAALVELDIKFNQGVLDVTDLDSVLHGHLEWWLLQVTDKVDADIVGNDVLSALGNNLWDDLKDLGGEVLGADLHWEELLVSKLHEGVDSVLVNPELFSVGTCEVWEFGVRLQFVGHLVAVLWLVEKAIEVDLDKAGVLDDAWGHRHGQVEWLLEASNIDIEGVWLLLLLGDHVVELVDSLVNSFAESKNNKLLDLFVGVLDDPVEWLAGGFNRNA